MISAGEPTSPVAQRTSSGSRRWRSSARAYATFDPAASRSGPARRSSSRAWSRRTSRSWPRPASGSSARSGLGRSSAAPTPRRWSPGAGRTASSRRSIPAGPSLAGSRRSARTTSSRPPRTSRATSTAGRRRCPRATSRPRRGRTGIALEIVHCGNGRTALFAHAGCDRSRRARAGSSSATTPRRGPGSSRWASCGRWPTSRRSAGSSRRRSSPWRPAIPRASTAGDRVIAAGRAADLCIVDAPDRVRGRNGAQALANGDMPGRRHGIDRRVPLVGRSRNTPRLRAWPTSSRVRARRGRPLGASGGPAPMHSACDCRASRSASSRRALPRSAPTCATPRTSGSTARC